MTDDGLTEAPPDTAEHLWFTVVRTTGHAAPGQTTAIRLIGLLPPDWECVSVVGNDEIKLGIPRASVPGSPGELRERLEQVVMDSALAGWSIGPP
ncbi:hypothetical protein ABZ070_03930 [Streptomyces sp. NPDC006283]|uniref:hypothetical protein n=1 Tax=Streptomyces sp. NPDC006283 TaxID=3156741 RepID=UPI0033A5B8D0